MPYWRGKGMKNLKWTICFVFVFLLILRSVLVAQNELDGEWEGNVCINWKTTPFGKVDGWVIDPDSGKPVTEEFNVRFFLFDYDYPEKPTYLDVKTDNNGHFNRKLPVGEWYVLIRPNKFVKYCDVPSPMAAPDQAYKINIENGKITKVWKKATIGGNVKVILVGADGEKLKVDEIFKNNEQYLVQLINRDTMRNHSRHLESDKNSSADKREFLIKNVIPGKYDTYFIARDANIFGKVSNQIIVESNKTTETQLMVDIGTGIEGIVTNTQGLPLADVTCSIWSENETGFPSYHGFNTDGKGWFRILGLQPGSYTLRFSMQDEQLNRYKQEEHLVNIIKGVILKANYTYMRLRND
jgi:hypothetical protein